MFSSHAGTKRTNRLAVGRRGVFKCSFSCPRHRRHEAFKGQLMPKFDNFLPVALLIHSRRVSLIFFFLPAVGYNGSRWHLAPGAQNTFLKTQHQFLFSEILTRLLKKSLLDLVVSTFDVVPFN